MTLALRMLGHGYWAIASAFSGLAACVLVIIELNEDAETVGDVKTVGFATGTFRSVNGVAGWHTQLLWTFLAIAILCQSVEFMEMFLSIRHWSGAFYLTGPTCISLASPLHLTCISPASRSYLGRSGVFYLTVVNMLKEDIMEFMPIFVMYVFIFWLTLYALYPADLQTVDQFNSMSPIGTLLACFSLAFAGDTFDIAVQDDYGNAEWDVSFPVAVNWWLFYATYQLFILLTVIACLIS